MKTEKQRHMIRRFNIILLVLLGFSFANCHRPDQTEQPVPTLTTGVYVLNQGNFGSSNSTISYINEQTKVVTSDIFSSVNQIPLGDVCQSMTKIGAYYYIVVNNSGKVVVVDTSSFKLVTTITGFTSPRYVLQISSTEAYVTDLYAGHISIVNLTTNQITGTIPVNSADTETMLMYNSMIYVAAPNSAYVYVVNPQSNAVQDSINVGIGVASMTLDAQNNLWTLSEGDYVSNPSFLAKVNMSTKQVLAKTTYPNVYGYSCLTSNASRSTLYWIGNGVCSLDATQAISNTNTLVSNKNHAWYGLAVHPTTGNVYAADAGDYNQNGTVYRYSPTGSQQENYTVGVSPGGFVFTIH